MDNNEINSTGNHQTDIVIYMIGLMSYASSYLVDFTSWLDVLCKVMGLIGFTFAALNQGYRFSKRNEKTIKQD